jgi:hypothetical protein
MTTLIFIWSFETIIAILGFVISICTLCLGIIAYRKFLSKQLKQKQLDTVCGLVEEIQNGFNIYLLNSGGQSKSNGWKTIIDVSFMQQFDKNFDKLYFFGQDENDLSEDILNWKFYTKYYSNPLLPKKIADNLKPFNNTHWRTVRYESVAQSNCVLIGRKKRINNSTSCFFIPNSPIETCKGFKNAILDLRKAIEEWFVSYGIKDLNYTTSHHYKEIE